MPSTAITKIKIEQSKFRIILRVDKLWSCLVHNFAELLKKIEKSLILVLQSKMFGLVGSFLQLFGIWHFLVLLLFTVNLDKVITHLHRASKLIKTYLSEL